jgi:hypothetical protein
METFIAACLGLLTLIHLIALVMLIAVLLQLRRSALAVETLALDAQTQVAKLGTAADRVREFASGLRSGWLGAFLAGLGALFATRHTRPRDRD